MGNLPLQILFIRFFQSFFLSFFHSFFRPFFLYIFSSIFSFFFLPFFFLFFFHFFVNFFVHFFFDFFRFKIFQVSFLFEVIWTVFCGLFARLFESRIHLKSNSEPPEPYFWTLSKFLIFPCLLKLFLSIPLRINVFIKKFVVKSRRK